MDSAVARLILLTPPVADASAYRPALTQACGAAEVAAVLLRLAPADERSSVNLVKQLAPVAHAAGAALILADPEGSGAPLDGATVAARGGADGLYLARPEQLRVRRERLGPDKSLAVGGLRKRHDAMEAGEAGADLVVFGEPRPDGSLPDMDGVLERAEWWADIFQIPCAAYAPTLSAVTALAETGAEFVMLGGAVWADPRGPGAASRDAAAALAALRAVA